MPASNILIQFIHIQHIVLFKVTALDKLHSGAIVSHDLAYHYCLPGYALLAPERDAAGQCLGGAIINKKHQLNLVKMSLA